MSAERRMLSAREALLDVDDVEGFVRACLDRFERDSEIKLERDEFEELVLEGMVIMYELAERFEPHREGYDKPGRFNGYAACFLPKRLGDAWHRRHPEHRYVTDPDTGKRRWEYLKGTVSLDAMRSEREEQGGEIESRLLERSKWTPVPVASTA